ncbi:MAG: cytochrome c [Croceibacterium sp.]
MNREFLRRHLPSLSFGIAALVGVIVASAGVIYFGAYNIAADAPHSRVVYSLLDELRDRSIMVRASNIETPGDLASADRISRGAGLYAEMCSGCHLGPGVEASEISQGLYPQAPELAHATGHSAGEQFWIIKHGVKLSAMPAWGKTHPDNLIWDMVAFVRAMPKMSAAQYQQTLASAPADHDEMMEGMADDRPGAASTDMEHDAMNARGSNAKPAHHEHAEGTVPHTD